MACCVAMAAAPCNTELDVPPVYIIDFKEPGNSYRRDESTVPNVERIRAGRAPRPPRGESLSECGVHSGGWRA